MTKTTVHRVYFVSDTGLTDTSIAGTVTDWTPEGPDGYVYNDLVEVTWDDRVVEIVSIDNICEAP